MNNYSLKDAVEIPCKGPFIEMYITANTPPNFCVTDLITRVSKSSRNDLLRKLTLTYKH